MSDNAKNEVSVKSWMRQCALWIFLAVFLSAACLHHPVTGWNVNTRLSLIFAVVDQGTFSIDSYHALPQTETMDKAVFEGRYYSDKIFGVSLLALPVYALVDFMAGLGGKAVPFQLSNWLLRVWAVSLPMAISASLLWMILVRLGAAPKRAVLGVAGVLLGSLWFGYGTVFYPYAPGICAAIGALYLILFPPARRLTIRNSFMIGLLCGFAAICDLTFGITILALCVVYMLRLLDQIGIWGSRAFAHMAGERSTPREGLGVLILGVIGGALPLLLFIAYSVSIFGSPTIPYKYEALAIFRENMSVGFMGVTKPKMTALYYLTIHPLRGIFFWSPIFILALIGAIMGTRQVGKRRFAGWLSLSLLVAYLLFNSGYYMWWAGWAMGPRLMLPMMVCVPLGLAEILRRDRHRFWWIAAVVLSIISVALSFPLSLLDPQIPLNLTDEELMLARFGDKFYVTQLAWLKTFYNGQLLPFVAGGLNWDFWLSRLSAIACAIIGFATAAKMAPAKHFPFETPENPVMSVDGTAAPLPKPMDKKPK